MGQNWCAPVPGQSKLFGPRRSAQGRSSQMRWSYPCVVPPDSNESSFLTSSWSDASSSSSQRKWYESTPVLNHSEDMEVEYNYPDSPTVYPKFPLDCDTIPEDSTSVYAKFPVHLLDPTAYSPPLYGKAPRLESNVDAQTQTKQGNGRRRSQSYFHRTRRRANSASQTTPSLVRKHDGRARSLSPTSKLVESVNSLAIYDTPQDYTLRQPHGRIHPPYMNQRPSSGEWGPSRFPTGTLFPHSGSQSPNSDYDIPSQWSTNLGPRSRSNSPATHPFPVYISSSTNHRPYLERAQSHSPEPRPHSMAGLYQGTRDQSIPRKRSVSLTDRPRMPYSIPKFPVMEEDFREEVTKTKHKPPPAAAVHAAVVPPSRQKGYRSSTGFLRRHFGSAPRPERVQYRSAGSYLPALAQSMGFAHCFQGNQVYGEGSSGPPPPVPRGPHPAFKERSQSVNASKVSDCSTLPPPHNGRQRSISGSGSRLHRQRSCKRTEEEDKLKKSRGWANAYELSQDLHDKQLEMLERKYGGHMRTRHAARIIQQAFRQYCMNKNFEKLRSVAGEKRLSQRLCHIGRSNTIWSDMVVDRGLNINFDFKRASMTTETCFNEQMTYEDNINQNFTTNGRTITTTRGMLTKSKSLSISVTEQIQGRSHQQKKLALNLPSVNEPQRTDKRSAQGTSPEETNNNRNSCPELNDSSASNSPDGNAHMELAVDLPSVNFENLLESKESDILNDSFHSDSSHGAVGPHSPPINEGTLERIHRHAARVQNSHAEVDEECDNDDTLKANQQVYDNYICSESCSDSDAHQVDDMDGTVLGLDHDRTPTEDDAMVKVYANQEVRLRKKRASSLEGAANSTPATPDCTSPSKLSPEASPIWKRKSALGMTGPVVDDAKRMSNISEVSEPDSTDGRESREGISSSASSDTASLSSDGGHLGYQRAMQLHGKESHSPQMQPKLSDRQRKRMYRIGLNLFNKKPEKGVKYLIERRFVDNRPSAVAKFLIARKGLSKQMIGEFLGNLQNPFNKETLECFTNEINLGGMQVDLALRRFQSYFRMPGEAQKIERIVECFAHWYCMMNPDHAKKFRTMDTVFLLAFAIIMLNTDLHNTSIKAERKMKLEDFIKNLRGLDDGEDIDRELLTGIYERIKATEFKSQADHVSQVMKVEQMLVGKKTTSQLSLPHRRLVCYCRLYEVNDPNKREKPGLHQREVFLFNDMLMVTKIFSRKKNHITYSYRDSFTLCGMTVYLYETQYYPHGIRLTTNLDDKVLITFNARNEHDRSKFVEDLKEAIAEMNEMEALRIEEELQKQKMVGQAMHNFNRHSNDSGMVDIELLKPSDPGVNRLSAPECGLKKTALSNSLIDLESSARRGSGGSLDSGMASTSSGSTGSHDDANVPPPSGKSLKQQQSGSKFSAIFSRKSKNPSKSSLRNNVDCSEV